MGRKCEKMVSKDENFLRNNFQIQDFPSLKCGYYCLCFLNEKNKGKKFADILKMFSYPIQRKTKKALQNILTPCEKYDFIQNEIILRKGKKAN